MQQIYNNNGIPPSPIANVDSFKVWLNDTTNIIVACAVCVIAIVMCTVVCCLSKIDTNSSQNGRAKAKNEDEGDYSDIEVMSRSGNGPNKRGGFSNNNGRRVDQEGTQSKSN